jgi:UTP--glucose-1-phosphate uridylyltransferase
MKVRKAVIPAAGIGSRMLPVTKTIPKEMLPLVDKPVIHYIVEEAVNAGIEDILIITNRGKTAIEDYFDYAPELEESLIKAKRVSELESIRRVAEMANINYVRQKETKGYGHAVWCAKSFVGDEPFAVMSGDDVIMADVPVLKQLVDAAEKHKASAVGAQLVSSEAISGYSSLKLTELEDRVYKVEDVVEKPKPEEVFSNFAILGRYVLTSEIFDILENTPAGHGNEIQLTDGLRTMCKLHPMIAVDFIGQRYDMGNPHGFLEATVDFALNNPKTAAWFREFLNELHYELAI